MRIVGWPEMEKFLGAHVGREAPSLEEELAQVPHWLGSKIFPLDPGDVLVRDIRVWHGGCPNLSREPRYLPSLEVASRELVAHFRSRGKAFPKQLLPLADQSSRSVTLPALHFWSEGK